MRKALWIVAMLALVTPALAANRFSGTWNLNAKKSTGLDPSTVSQLVAEDQGADEVITVTGKNADGSAKVTKFSIPINGGQGKIIDAKPFTAVTAKPSTANTEDFMFSTDGKPAMHIHSVLSSDGKVMTTRRHTITGRSNPGHYTDVWEKQE